MSSVLEGMGAQSAVSVLCQPSACASGDCPESGCLRDLAQLLEALAPSSPRLKWKTILTVNSGVQGVD